MWNAFANWRMFAGGTGAAEGKYGYSRSTEIGDYSIQPTTDRRGRHNGYTAYFLNVKGRLPGGLWQLLGKKVNLLHARRLCLEHEKVQS